jgi:Fe-Mn family superoxide dismutase
MTFQLEPLPYPKNALAPHISEQTVEFHYEKHHRGYVTKLNGLVQNTPLANKSLEELVKTETGKVFNNAAQVSWLSFPICVFFNFKMRT